MAKVEIIPSKDFKDFTEKVKLASKKSPSKIYKGMDKIGRKLRKELKDATPVSKVNKPAKKRLKARWRLSKTEREYNTYETKIRSTAPHYHLVERGHRLVSPYTRKGAKLKDGGKNLGKVEGQYFAKRVLDQAEPRVDKEIEKLFDEILGDAFD